MKEAQGNPLSSNLRFDTINVMGHHNYSTFPAKHGAKKYLTENDIYGEFQKQIDIKSSKHMALHPDKSGDSTYRNYKALVG